MCFTKIMKRELGLQLSEGVGSLVCANLRSGYETLKGGGGGREEGERK